MSTATSLVTALDRTDELDTELDDVQTFVLIHKHFRLQADAARAEGAVVKEDELLAVDLSGQPAGLLQRWVPAPV